MLELVRVRETRGARRRERIGEGWGEDARGRTHELERLDEAESLVHRAADREIVDRDLA